VRLPAVKDDPAASHPVRLVAFTNQPEELAAPPEPLAEASLGDLISLALANSPELEAAHMRAHALEERVPQVKALDDPTLMTTAFLEPIQTAGGPQDVIVSLSQKIPWFGKRRLRGDVAFWEAQAAFSRMADVELQLVEQVKLAYYELYYLHSALEVNRDLQGRLEDVIEIAKAKYEAAEDKTGLETVLQAQVELANLKKVDVQLEQAIEKVKAKLRRTIFLSPGAPLEVSTAIIEHDVPRSAETLVALIDQCQPQLEALRQEQTRDRAAIELAHKNFLPDATVGFNWHGIGPTGLSAVATGDDAYSLLVGVNLPIYKHKYTAGLREAEFKAARTAQQYDATWAQLREDVQMLQAEAVEHDRVLRILTEDILPQAKQTLDLSIAAYRVDRIGFQQLIDNYEALLQYRIEYYRRLSQREQALAQLERVVGCAITTEPVHLEEIE